MRIYTYICTRHNGICENITQSPRDYVHYVHIDLFPYTRQHIQPYTDTPGTSMDTAVATRGNEPPHTCIYGICPDDTSSSPCKAYSLIYSESD